jgi:hypothetical protein
MTTNVLRRHTVAAIASIALSLPLGACADGAAVAPASPTAKPSSPSQPAARPRPPAKAQPHAHPTTKAKGSGTTTAKPAATTEVFATDLFGTQYAYLKSAKANRLTFDLVQYFEYEDAVRACHADHVYASEGVWCADYYIRNKNPRLRTLGADPAGPYRLLTQDGPVEVSLWKFIAAMRGQDRVFKFYVDGGRILHADEVPA